MRKQKTSILFVDTKGKENKVLQIPTKLLLHWKKYFIIINVVIIVLLGIIGVFIYRSTSNSYKQKLANANKIRSLIDLKKVKETFKSIDSSTSKINQFLQKRGIENFEIPNAGGEENFEITDINEIADYYNAKLKTLENTTKKIPLGVPLKSRITSTFGYRSNPFTGLNTENHPGIDFKGKIGDSVISTAEGIVEFAGPRGGYGNCIIIKHTKSLETLYGHLSKINVKIGQSVNIGEIIGEVGSTGRSTGPHLHYEIIKNGEKINPKDYTTL